jgi:hypothetical protein
VGAFGAGITSYLLGNAFAHKASTWKGALWEGAKSTLLTFATLGLAKGLGLVAPVIGRALEPVTKPIGDAIAPIVRPIADAVADGAKPLTKALDGLAEAGQNARNKILQAAGRETETSLDPQVAAREWADQVRAGSPSKAKTPHVSAIVRDRRTGQIYTGTSGNFFEPYPETIHPDLAARLPEAPVVDGRAFQNCAEFKAVNKALLDGARWADLDPPIALVTKDGFPIEFCPNCQTWVPGPFLPPSVDGLEVQGVSKGFLQALDPANKTDGQK